VEIVSILLLVALVAIIQVARGRGTSGDEAERQTNPVRNSGRCGSKPSGASNPGGVVSKSTLAAEQQAFAAPKRLRPRRRGIVSNGGKEGHP